MALNYSSECESRADDLDFIIERIFSVPKRNNVDLLLETKTSDAVSRSESVLNSVIEDRIQTKALPLALRKRLLYQRSIE